MSTEIQPAQNPGIAKIRALLLAARPGLTTAGRAAAVAFQQPPAAPGDPVPDRSPAIGPLLQQVTTLRGQVEGVTVQGAAAVSARDLTARALLETEQSLAKLAESYGAPDQPSATALLAESVRLLKAAKATGVLAGKALGIPWPLQ
jgi:hypothetical protein